MKRLLPVLILIAALAHAEPKVLLRETFASGPSTEWFWGLGTWTAKDGILRGFESGPRRHGPVKMHKLRFADAIVEFEYRLRGKATFAGIIFNGDQERGHLLHLLATKDAVRLIAHASKGAEPQDLIHEECVLPADQWHHVRIEIHRDSFAASVDGHEFHARHACIGEIKEAFGLGGESGGPEGEKAGALEFRDLLITSP